MPKKRQNPALLTKPASSAPSTHKSNGPSSGSNGVLPESSRSVNDLIRESRYTKSKERVGTAATSSIHPTLRAVFDMPAPSPPSQRTHILGPARLRRIPGPPPPQSWLADSQHAPESSRSTFHQLRWLRARIQQQSSTLPGGNLPKQNSLEHAALKTMASNWSRHAEYDNVYLATLPVGTRTKLLSYLAVYDEKHWPNPFPLLFPIECEQDELDEVTRLDLTNSIGGWAATVKKIERELVTQKEVAKYNNSGAQLRDQDAVDGIPDSWDDSSAEDITSQLSKISLASSRFTNLKHLSLAVNLVSSTAPPSWTFLVSLSSHLSQLRSLSLAHWPAPTYTPNAAKGRVTIVNTALPSLPTQPFGGSDMYTAFDNDWREAGGILRSLSRNLYCLSWLDLSGCGPWLPALTWHDENAVLGSADWNGAWRSITHVVLGVGWLPGRPPSIEDSISSSRSSSSIDSTRAIEQLYGRSEHIQETLRLLAASRLGVLPRSVDPGLGGLDDGSQPLWNVEHERAKQYFRKDVERYNSQQHAAKTVAEQIRGIRRAAQGRYIEFEIGEVLGVEYNINDRSNGIW